MAISAKNTKILWAAAAGRCAFPDCREKLCADQAGTFAPYTIGEMAHIKGERAKSNRHDPDQDLDERDAYPNLILLCPTHHTLIDQKENEDTYGADRLLEMKAQHEAFISSRLDDPTFENKWEVAASIYHLLVENHEVWIAFGPLSDIARKNPNSEDAYAVWRSERLSTIVPNSRLMLASIEANKKLFSADEQAALAAFSLHARSYERWVADEVAYEAVVRFPKAFETLIKGLVDARA